MILFFKYLCTIYFLLCTAMISKTESTPESVEITNLPDQTQKIYQGWISVDQQAKSFLYYQLFFSQNTTAQDPSTIPLLLFLEGGPCDSSVQTLWTDFGPYWIDSNLNVTGPNDPSKVKFTLLKRNTTWSGPYHVLAIDSPVLTGFSYSETNTSVNDTIGTGKHLINFLTRFYQIYDNLVANPFFVIGHSYGGHWAPYLVYTLVKDHNLTLGNVHVNLGGLIAMNTYISLKQRSYPNYIYAAGLTDLFQRDYLANIDYQVTKNLRAGKTADAIAGLLQEMRSMGNSMGRIVTTNTTIDNIRRYHLLDEGESYESKKHNIAPRYFFGLNEPGVESARTMFNIPDNIAPDSGFCEQNFIDSGDFAVDFTYTIEYLLTQGVYVTIISGQDDGIVTVPGVIKLVSALNWPKANDYKLVIRQPWYSFNGSVLGVYKKDKSLNNVVLYKSGHCTTFDQPESIMEFLHRVTLRLWQ